MFFVTSVLFWQTSEPSPRHISGAMRSAVPADFTQFKRKGTLISNQAAAGSKILGKPRDKDQQGREILTSVGKEAKHRKLLFTSDKRVFSPFHFHLLRYV
jgi:hypothetical protein